MQSNPMPVGSEIVLYINDALNEERQKRGCRSDIELAVHLGLSPKVISFWRNGRFTRTDAILVNLLLSRNECERSDVTE